MKVDFDISAGKMEDEMYNTFLTLNPYQSNQPLRTRIAVASAIAALAMIRSYSENYLMSEDFFKQVKKCLLIKLNG